MMGSNLSQGVVKKIEGPKKTGRIEKKYKETLPQYIKRHSPI